MGIVMGCSELVVGIWVWCGGLGIGSSGGFVGVWSGYIHAFEHSVLGGRGMGGDLHGCSRLLVAGLTGGGW